MTDIPAPPEPTESPSGTRLRAAVVPSEHGGWSLTVEPALLGLIVAPGAAGWLLALAALLSFVVRTPLKVSVGDRLRRRRLPRTALADRVIAVEAAILAAVVGAAIVLAERPFWLPLVPGLPLIAIGLWHDVRARSRRLAAELAGTVGVAAIGPMIVLADGGTAGAAIGVWMVAAARAVAAVAYVRLQLRRAKGQPFARPSHDATQLGAVVLVALGVAPGYLPVLGVVVIAMLAVFHIVASRRPAPRAAVLGAQQVVWGLAIVVTVGLAMAAP